MYYKLSEDKTLGYQEIAEVYAVDITIFKAKEKREFRKLPTPDGQIILRTNKIKY